MPTRELRLGDDLKLPLEAVTEAFAVLAVSGAGKSNAGVVLAEELYDNNLPFVAVDPKGDWWGIRSSADGKSAGLSVVVFGGEHGDVPLEPTAGRYIADLIVDQRLSCVLDVSEMTKADVRRFLQDFAERLYRRNREPLMVILEEADEYIPQMVRGDVAKLVGAMETLVKRGRFRGIGTFMVTQRSASLNNDVLTQARNLFAMQTTAPPDKKAVLAWIAHHTSSREVIDELPQLQPGEAWFFSPAWMRTLKKIKFRRRRTYDSGATPKIGEKRRPPARLADVDLAVIKEAMAETIERAKADDPRELRKQITALKQEALRLGRARDEVAAELLAERAAEKVRIEEVRTFTQDDERTLGDVDESLELVAREVAALRAKILERLPVGAKEGTAADPRPARTETPAPVVTAARPQAQRTPSARRVGTPEVRPSPPQSGTDGPLDRLSKSQRAILDTLAWFESVRILAPLRSQVAWQAGVSPRSSGFEKNCSTLRTAGLIHYPGANRLGLTDEGRTSATAPSTPATTGALQESILSHLSGSQRSIILSLLDVYPEGLDREALADRCGVSPRSSGFEKNCSTLRTLGLADYPQTGVVAATEMLFID